MPSYKVIRPGFFHGRLYEPEGKRPVLHVDLPFTTKGKNKNMPSWVEALPDESTSARSKRQVGEKSKNDADAKKAAQDKKDIENASFMGDGEKSSAVETL